MARSNEARRRQTHRDDYYALARCSCRNHFVTINFTSFFNQAATVNRNCIRLRLFRFMFVLQFALVNSRFIGWRLRCSTSTMLQSCRVHIRLCIWQFSCSTTSFLSHHQQRLTVSGWPCFPTAEQFSTWYKQRLRAFEEKAWTTSAQTSFYHESEVKLFPPIPHPRAK